MRWETRRLCGRLTSLRLEPGRGAELHACRLHPPPAWQAASVPGEEGSASHAVSAAWARVAPSPRPRSQCRSRSCCLGGDGHGERSPVTPAGADASRRLHVSPPPTPASRSGPTHQWGGRGEGRACLGSGLEARGSRSRPVALNPETLLGRDSGPTEHGRAGVASSLPVEGQPRCSRGGAGPRGDHAAQEVLPGARHPRAEGERPGKVPAQVPGSGATITPSAQPAVRGAVRAPSRLPGAAA